MLTAIKAVQFRGPNDAQATIAASVTLARLNPEAPLDAADLARLLPMLERRGFIGRDVIVSAPVTALESEILDLPARSSGAPVDTLAVAEIQRIAKLEPGAFQASSWDIPAARAGGQTGTSVLAVALRHADAESFLAPFDAAGLRVRAIDTPGWALARVQAKPPADAIVAVLDVGWRSGVVTLIGDEGVIYHRVLQDCGSRALYTQVKERHDLSDDAADLLLCEGCQTLSNTSVVNTILDAYVSEISNEVGASLAFARHRYAGRAVSAVRLAGGAAKLRGFADSLGKVMSVPVEPFLPAQVVGSCDARIWPQIAMAAGLALYDREDR
jgi:Tfp pilus assembly PilM family ATPase